MARTPLPITVVPALVTAASAVAATYTAGDAVNNNSIALTGQERILVKNTDTASHSILIHSVADPFGRVGDLTIPVAAGVELLLGQAQTVGFQQADGTLWVDPVSALVEFLVLRG